MAGYIESTLTRDEKVIYKGKVSLVSLSVPIVLGVIFSISSVISLINGSGILILNLIGPTFLLYVYVIYTSTELGFTNKKIISKYGFISRSTVELSQRNFETIEVEQGILGRIFDFGSVVIRGKGNAPVVIKNISMPLTFSKKLSQFQEDFHNPDQTTNVTQQTMSDKPAPKEKPTSLIECKSCYTMNKPELSECRKCGVKI